MTNYLVTNDYCTNHSTAISLLPRTRLWLGPDTSIAPSSCARLVSEDNMLQILFHACPSPFYPQTLVSRSHRKPFYMSSVISHGSQQPIFAAMGVSVTPTSSKIIFDLWPDFIYFPDFAHFTCCDTSKLFKRIVVCQKMNFLISSFAINKAA